MVSLTQNLYSDKGRRQLFFTDVGPAAPGSLPPLTEKIRERCRGSVTMI
jgi:hypothetical protein